MTNIIEIDGQRREKVGTGPARAVRKNEEIPSIVYGSGHDNMAISVDKKTMDIELKDPSYLTKLYLLKVDGKKEQTVIRDVQYHPVTDRIVHIDFYRVNKDSRIHVDVPVRFINESNSPGMKRGGVLNIIMHKLDLNCSAVNIPDYITVDLTGLNLGDAVHLETLDLPEGATPVSSDSTLTIATIVVPSAVKSAEEEEKEEERAEEADEDAKASEKE